MRLLIAEDDPRLCSPLLRGLTENGYVVDGAGLGLSIGDAIVRATGGVWQVTTSALGGARFQVRWPRAQPRRFRDRLRIRSSA